MRAIEAPTSDDDGAAVAATWEVTCSSTNADRGIANVTRASHSSISRNSVGLYWKSNIDVQRFLNCHVIFVAVLSAFQLCSRLFSSVFHHHVFNNSFPLFAERFSLERVYALLDICHRRPPVMRNELSLNNNMRPKRRHKITEGPKPERRSATELARRDLSDAVKGAKKPMGPRRFPARAYKGGPA